MKVYDDRFDSPGDGVGNSDVWGMRLDGEGLADGGKAECNSECRELTHAVNP
jgi:hypothetical protein